MSWLRKLSPIHTHPLISIREFLKTYQLLFFELESLITHPLVSTLEFLKPYGVEWVIHGWGGIEWVIQGWGGVGHAVKQPNK